MNETGIIWSERTWNPFSGCEAVSEGCKFCYAETLAEKYRGNPAFPNGFDLTLRPHKLKEPCKLKEPTLIFMNSMSDLFLDKLPDDYRHKVLDVIEDNPQHEFQSLTKRPHNMLAFSKKRKLPKNFWAGVTIESALRMKERLPILKQVDAEIRWISMEPLLSPIPHTDLSGIQWVVTGGESGTHLWQEKWQRLRAMVYYDRTQKKWIPKPHAVQWIKDIDQNCKDYGVKHFFKQWGGSYPEAAGRELDGKFISEMPRLPGGQTQIDNAYLRYIESGKTIAKNRKEQLLQKSLF